jgi:hypothetical protein
MVYDDTVLPMVYSKSRTMFGNNYLRQNKLFKQLLKYSVIFVVHH